MTSPRLNTPTQAPPFFHPTKDVLGRRAMVERWPAEDLRRLAREDEEARRLTQEGDNNNDHAATEDEDDSLLYRMADGRTILNYAAFLAKQHVYDDLKHVDANFIDYDDAGWLLIEQDKSLGKGGLCWDAAYILADYLSSSTSSTSEALMTSETTTWNDGVQTITRRTTTTTTRAIELGAGTGVCGLLVAQRVSGWHIALTDLPALQTLLKRNAARFLHHWRRYGPPPPGDGNLDNDDDNDDDIGLRQYYLERDKSENADRHATSVTTTTTSGGSTVEVYPLDWADVVAVSADNDDGVSSSLSPPHRGNSRIGKNNIGPYDIVLGADVVATLYDPVALAGTIQKLCHDDTIVYISFKERLSSIHRQFETEMVRLFTDVNIVDRHNDGQPLSRNRNPDVRILIAKGVKTSS